MTVYIIRDGCAQTAVRAATQRQKLQIKLTISLSHSTLTPGQTVPALSQKCKIPSKEPTGVPAFTSLVWLSPEKASWKKPESNLGLLHLMWTQMRRCWSTETEVKSDGMTMAQLERISQIQQLWRPLFPSGIQRFHRLAWIREIPHRVPPVRSKLVL